MTLIVSNPLAQSWKTPVRVATDADLPANTPSGSGRGKTLTANSVGALTVDGRTLSVGQRVLVKNYGGTVSSLHNGVYSVIEPGSPSTSWILVRVTDLDGFGPSTEVGSGLVVIVNDGDANIGKGFRLSTQDPITVDATALRFDEFGAGGGGGGGGGGAPPVLTGSLATDSAGSTAAYLTAGGFSASSARRYPLSAIQFHNLRVTVLQATAGVVADVTLYHNGSPTAMTVTVGVGASPGTKIADTAHTVTFVDGDDYDVVVAALTDSAPGIVELSVSVGP